MTTCSKMQLQGHLQVLLGGPSGCRQSLGSSVQVDLGIVQGNGIRPTMLLGCHAPMELIYRLAYFGNCSARSHVN